MAYVVMYFHQDFCFFVQDSVWQEWPSLVHPLLHCHWYAAYWWGFLAWKICFLSHCWSKKAQSHGEEQNFEALSQFGGVKALAMILGTNIKGVTSGNVVDLIHWKNVFDAKKYQREPAKGLLSYVFKAFEATTVIVLLVCAIISLPLESNSIRLSSWEYYRCCCLGCCCFC